MSPRSVHPLVSALAKGLVPPKVQAKTLQEKPPVPARDLAAGSSGALAFASDVPDTIMFAGFLGESFQRPGGGEWQVLYLDLELTDWLLVENIGIVDEDQIVDDAVPYNQRRDVIWVRADAAVGRGHGSQSVEAQFLTGDFTRAGDFEAPPTGGTLAAATGVFCEARTPSCCRRMSRG